jgi:hypothetical protein
VQSVSPVQVVAHPLAAVHVKPLQGTGVPATQFPLPSQVEAGVKDPPPQLAARQTVELPWNVQPPCPSQVPVSPHELAAAAMQVPAGSAFPDDT